MDKKVLWATADYWNSETEIVEKFVDCYLYYKVSNAKCLGCTAETQCMRLRDSNIRID
jgi:hypothetical protein